MSGLVDSNLFDTVAPCNEKTDPLAGNRIYLYKGFDTATDSLADVFTTASTVAPPSKAIAPFAVGTLLENQLTGNWEYAFGYLPAGDYTLAFACDAEDDDAVEYNGLLIPLPEGQRYKITLTESKKSVCNLAEGASC